MYRTSATFDLHIAKKKFYIEVVIVLVFLFSCKSVSYGEIVCNYLSMMKKAEAKNLEKQNLLKGRVRFRVGESVSECRAG